MSFVYFLLLLFSYKPAYSSDACGPGSHWVRAHHRSGYVRYDGVVVSDTVVSGHCRGNQKSYGIWKDSFLNSIPIGWPHKNEKDIKWKVDEIERILEALDSLPSFLSNLKGVKIYRMKKSSEPNNPGTSAINGNIIVLYDEAFKSKNFSRVLSHELAHQLYNSLDSVDRDAYNLVAGARKFSSGNKYYLEHRSSGYVAEDGKMSINEDFANNIEYYIFEPKKLKKVTPGVYEYFQKTYKK
ncbi:MAG: hypothetical protein IPM57_11150 [Oligoflexia bacterium]|nr:hypothetical protein [Oligoflexia bacterium]